jgi:hypothetical protein
MVSLALIVVRENFDNAAVTDATMITFIDHALQFVTQGLQLLDTTFNLYQVTAGDTVGLMAGILWPFRHGKQFAYVGNFETKRSGVPDETQPVEMAAIVAPLISLGSQRFWQQSDRFIVSDGRHLGAGPFGQLTNWEVHRGLLDATALLAGRTR